MPSISSKSWNISGAHLRVIRGNRPSERTMPVKILPRTLKQRSSPHGISSVTSGKERQSLRIHSTSGMGPSRSDLITDDGEARLYVVKGTALFISLPKRPQGRTDSSKLSKQPPHRS